jgi:amino acid permease
MARLGIAIATLIGTIIGAGILGIPYVVAKSGLIAGLADLIGIGLLLTVLNLYLGEIALRTKGNHQLTGYAEKYLGKKGKLILAVSMIIEIYGALLAYTIGEGTSFYSILGFGSPFAYSLIFFALGGILVYHGLKTIGKAEFWMDMFLIAVICIVFILSIPHISTPNFEAGKGNIFIPYGVILFACLGITSVPLLKEELAGERKKVKKAIIIGSLIPVAIYAAFTLCVVGIIGINGFNSLSENERIASAALNIFVDGPMGILINIFAILAMGTSFLALGTALTEMYKYDYKIKKAAAVLLTLTVPFVLFIINSFYSLTNFIQILGITGAVAGGITGNLIVIMFHKAKKHGERRPEYTIKAHYLLSAILIIVFAAGIAYSIAQII